ncbi:methyl-accepting chemotaxis protein [Sediminibacillus massiliensis]|uniref:methyl-accepting chemotaxis protein n=1 Tax=Sediminibacillus massiliensis TaxID=1926277 RepID=UPI0009882E15
MVFTTLLAVITYSTSAVFIYVVNDYVKEYWAVSEAVFVMVTLLAGIIWSGILAYFAAGFIIKSLTKLEAAAVKVAEGNLNGEVDIPKSKDEIQSLALAFSSMLSSMKEIISKIDNNFEKTNQSVKKIQTVSVNAAKQTNDIEEAIHQISEGAESTSTAIQITAESIDSSTRLAEQVQQKANISEQKSQEMVHNLNESTKVIHTLVSGIQSFAQEQEEALKDVHRLEENAKEIEKITGMVGEISEQTNLLALNASIEAARAGEHGKGFAVVADEVRKLADESKQAVQGISQLVGSIQSDVQKVVVTIGGQVTFARKEASKGEETNEAIQDMAVSINEVVSAIQDISEHVTEQLKSIHATSLQSREVAAIAEETSASAQEMNSMVREQSEVIKSVEELATSLQNQAEILKKEIQRFKMEETNPEQTKRQEQLDRSKTIDIHTKLEKGA